MPREDINDMVAKGWTAQVSWRPRDDRFNGHVQVATLNPASGLTLQDGDDEPEPFPGWYVTLDETGLTRLIKALHKAKRQAFPPKADQTPPLQSRRIIGDAEDYVFIPFAGSPHAKQVLGETVKAFPQHKLDSE